MRKLLIGLVVGCAATSASAAIQTGIYELFNHPDGDAQPPRYGLRLDELYDATGGHDIFTFDFENVSSNMRMNYTGSSIRIYGTVFGGRDTGSGYAADAYRGVYSVDFTYNLGVGTVPGDDDVWVDTANHANSGSIVTPLGDTVGLVDERMGYSFRLGDEDNDLGHRGFAGISGWGWLTHGGRPHVAASDFLFTTGANPIPAPGAALLGMVGFAMVGWARRRLA